MRIFILMTLNKYILIIKLNVSELKWKSLSHVQLFVTPLDYPVHGILQARILEWVAVPFSRGSSQPRDRTQVSHIAGGFFISWATREALNVNTSYLKINISLKNRLNARKFKIWLSCPWCNYGKSTVTSMNIV